MAQQEIPLKYRAICPTCHQAFDMRKGSKAPDGHLICGECYSKLKFRTIAPQPRTRHREINW